MDRPIVIEMNEFISSEWPDDFYFDRDEANETGTVVIRWALTKLPIPLNLDITEEAFDRGRIFRRELKRKISECLPGSLIKARISDANALLRGANRRDNKSAERLYKKWLLETADDLRKSMGSEASEIFLKEISPPTRFHSQSIQSLQFLVENKIDCLKNLR